MHADTALRRLEALPDLVQAGKRVNGLFRLLSHRPLWTEGLTRIKRNKGAGTPGIDGSTVSALGEADIETIIQKLMEGTYRPKPVKRVYIPKANGKLRALGIPTWSSKLVQEALRLLLDAYYEPRFSDHSHGFRQGRGCHTALREITQKWRGVKWFIEGDIKGCFDNICHEVLLETLSETVQDNRLLRLVSNMLKAGYMEDWRYNDTVSGTPQGGVITPPTMVQTVIV